MNRYILVSLLLMAWGYWELSGGSDFVPQEYAVAETDPVAPGAKVEVTRADTGPLDTIDLAPQPVVSATSSAETAPTDATLAEPQLVADTIVEALAGAPAPAAAAPSETPVAAPVAGLHVVTGDRVNLREGPGRDFTAIDQLASGTIAEVVETGSDGWVRIQIQGTATTGWMSVDFLTPISG